MTVNQGHGGARSVADAHEPQFRAMMNAGNQLVDDLRSFPFASLEEEAQGLEALWPGFDLAPLL